MERQDNVREGRVTRTRVPFTVRGGRRGWVFWWGGWGGGGGGCEVWRDKEEGVITLTVGSNVFSC